MAKFLRSLLFGHSLGTARKSAPDTTLVLRYWRTRRLKDGQTGTIHLYMEGEEKGVAEPARVDGAGASAESAAAVQAEGPALRKGFSREVIANKGRLSWGELLRCRVRYCVDGAVIGSKAFVDEVFESNRSRFGPNRVDGGCRLRHCQEKLYALRNLRLDPVATPNAVEGTGR